MYEFKVGATSQTIDVFIPSNAVTTGEGLTGLVYSTAGLTCYSRKGATGTSTVVTLATQTVGGAYSSGGFVEVDATNQKGVYRFDIPNGLIDTLGRTTITFRGAANMAPVSVVLNVVAFDPTDGVRLGLTALPNAAAAASGGLLISGSNAGTTTFGALTVTGATTCTGNVSMAAGLTITQSTSNGSGIDVTGNGTGAGIKATSGSSIGANGISAVSTASVGGSGISAAGSNAGHGIVGTGGATGSGFSGVGGATSGAGIRGTAQAGNSAGMSLAGSGSSAGFIATGGATGHGINAVGGATSGDGLKAEVTSGAPIRGAITGDVTGNLSGSVGSVTGAVGSVTGAVGGNVVGSVGSLATQAKADVNAEIVDALTVDTIAELTGDPGATPTVVKALALLFMKVRNLETSTATTSTIANSAGTTILSATKSDDGTTFTRGKLA